MRTTLSIDDEVLEAARAIAAQQGSTVGDVISTLARRALQPTRLAVVDGIPVFDVPAGLEMLTQQAVADALDDA